MSPNQLVGFVVLWGTVSVLGYLNSRTLAPDPSAPVVGTG